VFSVQSSGSNREQCMLPEGSLNAHRWRHLVEAPVLMTGADTVFYNGKYMIRPIGLTDNHV
jgi:hypothetical protein